MEIQIKRNDSILMKYCPDCGVRSEPIDVDIRGNPIYLCPVCGKRFSIVEHDIEGDRNGYTAIRDDATD